jgi:putative transposase
MKYQRQSGAHSTFLLTYHLIWWVKYRRSVLTYEIGDRLKEMVTEILKERDCTLIAVETELDHIHVVFRCKPSTALSELVKRLKGLTAYKLFREFPNLRSFLWKGHLWSPSYFIVTVGGAPLEVIKKYVESQREK